MCFFTITFFSEALFITFSDLAHDTYFLHRYPVEKIARTPMRGFWKKPLQRVYKVKEGEGLIVIQSIIL